MREISESEGMGEPGWRSLSPSGFTRSRAVLFLSRTKQLLVLK